MIATSLTAAAAISGLAAIVADRGGRRHASFFVLKPLTTLLILGVALAAPAHTPDEYRLLVAAALVFSLAGDVCLMFEGNRWFAGGLASFLLAHLLFIPAFLAGVGHLALPPWSVAVALYAGGLAVVLLRRAGPLRVPVLLYVIVLGGMAFAAMARNEAQPGVQSGLALAGALLFVASDSALGIRRFLGEYRGAQALILATYWGAIALIAWSV